jgi:hypothetical protein
MVKMSEARIFLVFVLERRVLPFHRGIVHPPAAIIARATHADRPDGNPPFTRLVRGFLALLAFCYSFWAAAVSGAAVTVDPRRRATARREGARARSYASRGAATVPWAGRSGHTTAIRGAHGEASAPWGLGSTRRAWRKNIPIPGAGHPTPRGPVGAEVGLRRPSRGPWNHRTRRSQKTNIRASDILTIFSYLGGQTSDLNNDLNDPSLPGTPNQFRREFRSTVSTSYTVDFYLTL